MARGKKAEVFERFFPVWAAQVGLGLVLCGFDYDSDFAELLGVTLLLTLLLVYTP